MLIKTIISYDISICHLKRTKILYIFIFILYFQNFYAIYLCMPQMFIQLLLFKYANVILTETITVLSAPDGRTVTKNVRFLFFKEGL